MPLPAPVGKGVNVDMIGGALGSGGLRTDLGDTRSGLPIGNGFDNIGKV